MAYEIHIDLPISEHQWVEYVRQEKDLSLIHEVEAINPITFEVTKVSLTNSGKAVSGQIIRNRANGDSLTLTSKYTDENSLKVMKKIAKELGGIVFGDEGEQY